MPRDEGAQQRPRPDDTTAEGAAAGVCAARGVDLLEDRREDQRGEAQLQAALTSCAGRSSGAPPRHRFG